jgi:hypothetical protein
VENDSSVFCSFRIHNILDIKSRVEAIMGTTDSKKFFLGACFEFIPISVLINDT